MPNVLLMELPTFRLRDILTLCTQIVRMQWKNHKNQMEYSYSNVSVSLVLLPFHFETLKLSRDLLVVVSCHECSFFDSPPGGKVLEAE